MYEVACYIMDHRYDAQNMIQLDIPLEPMNRYIRQKHAEGISVSHLALIIGAYLRICAEFKQLNYFVVNKRLYCRNEFTCGMVVLKPGETDGTMNKMHLDFTDGILEVQRKVDDYIAQNRREGDTNSTDRMIRFLLKVPGLVNVGVGIFKWMDKHGLLPKKIIDASPFHCSLSVSNLASIRTNYIYHHCYEFGTTSLFITLGNAHEVPVQSENGVRHVRCLPLGVVMDERICSGSYYATAFKRMKTYLADPTRMEGAPRFEIWSK